MPDVFQMLAQMAEGKGARSTTLHSLLWLNGVTLAPFAMVGIFGAPMWIQIFFGAMAGIGFLTSILTFRYCLLKDPMLLRTEKFLIRKMEIEQSSIGDSVRGVLDQSTFKALPSPNEPTEGPIDG